MKTERAAYLDALLAALGWAGKVRQRWRARRIVHVRRMPTDMRGAPIEAEHNTQKNPTPAHAAGPERTGLDTEWCAERASDALRWLALHFPECSGSEALHAPQDAAHEAAVAGDEAAYLEALRQYMRAGRDVALGVRRGAA